MHVENSASPVLSHQDSPAPAADGTRKRSDGCFALSLALITLLSPVATDMYLASMLDISHQLDVSYGSVQLTLTVFLMAQGVGQLFWGPVTDRFGRRVPLLLGIAGFVLSSVWAASSGALLTLTISRFLQGLSGALLLVIGFSSVRDVADGLRAARLFAILLTLEGLAPIFAPIAGGYVDAHFGWRAVLLCSAIMGICAFINSFIHLPETLPKNGRIPLEPGVIWKHYRRIAADRAFLLPTLGLSGVFFFLFAYIGGGAYLYQDVYQLTPDQFGLVFGVTGCSVMLGAISSGRLAKSRSIPFAAITGVIFIIAGTAVAFVASLSLGLPGIIAGFIIALYGLGMAEPSFVSLTMGSQTSALGFTAALMGAAHLALSSLSTPISGFLLPRSVSAWFVFLLVAGLLTLALAFAVRRQCGNAASDAERPEAI